MRPDAIKTRVMLVLGAAAAFVIGAVGDLAACQICFNGRVVTIGEQLDAADQAVLAVPLSNGNHFRILVSVKGGSAVNELIEGPVSRVNDAILTGGKPLLLVHGRLGQQWWSVGAIGVEHAGWLKRLAASQRGDGAHLRSAWPATARFTSSATSADERAALVAPYLESPEPLAAQIAYEELSRTPYDILRRLKPRLSAASTAQWIDDPGLVARRSTYLLLLGIAGGSQEAARLQPRIEAKLQARDAADLAAMLAADLELNGPQRVDWIEKQYLVDRNRTLPEIEAALLALSVHGGADGAVPRSRVIAAYRLFMRERKPMAGFVAQDLADWEYWDATADYAAILKSDVVKDPASHFMIVNYLRRSPQAAAKAALRPATVDR